MSSTDYWPLIFNDDPWVQEVIHLRALHEKQKAEMAAKHAREKTRLKQQEWVEWRDETSDPIQYIKAMQQKIYNNYKYTPTLEMVNQALEAFLARHPEKRAELDL